MSSPSSNPQSGQLSREDIAKVWNAVFIPIVMPKPMSYTDSYEFFHVTVLFPLFRVYFIFRIAKIVQWRGKGNGKSSIVDRTRTSPSWSWSLSSAWKGIRTRKFTYAEKVHERNLAS
jgi:hypothetical protein